MITSDETDKLLPALIEARKAIKPAAKGGENKFHRYTYAKEEDWHQAVMPALLDNDLVLAFSVTDILNLEPRKTKQGGTEYVVEVHGAARLSHASGQFLEVTGVGQGQEGSDKAAYQAMTGMKKYLYALMFALPTTDDPENDNRPPENAPKGKPKGKPKGQPKRRPEDMTEEERMGLAWEAIAAASKDNARLEKLSEAILTRGFSPENQQALLERCTEHLTALMP